MTRLKGWLRPKVLRRQAPGIALAVGGVVVLGLIVWLLVAPRDAAQRHATSPLSSPTATSTPADEIGLRLPRKPTVVVLGDSWSAGVGAGPGQGWVDRVSQRRGWTSGVIPGGATTGYLTPGVLKLGTYRQRLATMPRDKDVDLVVIQGGLADLKAKDVDTMRFNKAARRVLRLAKRTYPAAERLVIGPLNPYSATPGDVEAIDSRLGFEARQAGVPYISPTQGQWFGASSEAIARNLSGSAAGDPNAKGYKRFANEVIADLKELAAIETDRGQ